MTRVYETLGGAVRIALDREKRENAHLSRLLCSLRDRLPKRIRPDEYFWSHTRDTRASLPYVQIAIETTRSRECYHRRSFFAATVFLPYHDESVNARAVI